MESEKVMSMLREIEAELKKDTSGDDYLRSAKQYVGCTMLLINAAENRKKNK